ncbi:MAG: BamA/TamA family outer membrane protein [Chthonomonas sp.]|nr:BamA/TamA family outer membrane protein [Chthonomonas sp.]
MTKGLTVFAIAMLVAANAAAQTGGGTVREVIVRGNQYIASESIMTAMSLTTGRPYDASKILADKRAIENLGLFKDVKVLSQPITETDWRIIVEVAENAYIKEIRISGNTVVATKDLLALVRQPVNAVFSFLNIAPTSDAVSALYEKRGYYAQAELEPLEDSPGTLNVRIIERAVNEIKVTGLQRTRPSVVRRLMKTEPGQAFSEQKWAIDRRRLESTGWFEALEASSEPTADIGKFNLLLDVKEMRTAQIGFGASLDPRSRLAGSLRFNDSNWNGLGQTLGLLLQQDTAGKGLSTSFEFANPYMDSRDTQMAFSAYSRVSSYFTGSGIGNNDSPNDQDFDERRTGASLGFSRPVSRDWTVSLGSSFERISTIDRRTNINNNANIDFIQQDGDLLGFRMGLARDRRDVPLDPAEGDYFRFLLEPYLTHITKIGGNVGANTDILGKHKFLRSTFEYKSFWSKRPKDPKKLADPRNVIAFRARYSRIDGAVPFFEQIFVGGADSLRGYSDQRFWGKQAFVTTLEYRKPVQKSFNLIGFVDYGGAWGGYGSLNNFKQSPSLKTQLGYGVGVSFRTPLGAIRVDLGFNEKGGNRTHFSIGGSF